MKPETSIISIHNDHQDVQLIFVLCHMYNVHCCQECTNVHCASVTMSDHWVCAVDEVQSLSLATEQSRVSSELLCLLLSAPLVTNSQMPVILQYVYACFVCKYNECH